MNEDRQFFRQTENDIAPDPATKAILVEGITKRYGAFEAVKGIDFSVAEGEIFGLLGPNGAGKSTLIRMMTTLIPLSGGRAVVAGHDVTYAPDAVRRNIGVIPQAMTSDRDLTVEENLSIYAKFYGIRQPRRKMNIAGVLEAVDLLKWRDAPVKTLSGGMRRRVEIARGLVHNPRIFFLDEPTTGLDPVSRIVVWEMLNHLKHSRKLTILITTHYMDEADRLCDRIAIVDHGQIVAMGTPASLKQTISGSTVVEVQLSGAQDKWLPLLRELPGVREVKTESSNVYRMLTTNGSQVAARLVELAAARGENIEALTVQNTSLDDVFVHYTGRQLREESVNPLDFLMPQPEGAQR
jgi:ABC-2 type transport system ATP-binding protein